MRVRYRPRLILGLHAPAATRWNAEGCEMVNENNTVLVTGATGRQGGAVNRHMLSKGWKLRALTRDPGSHAARTLAQKGVEVVQGDLEDAASVARATAGVYGVYSVQDFWAVGAKREVQQGKNVADAAKKAGVKHFVYSSVGGAERNTGIPHWESKWEVEKHIRSLGLPATVIRPAAFMETYYIDQVEIGILKGKLADPEAAKVFSRVLGKPVKFQKLPLPLIRLVLGKEFYQMFRWFNESGFKADIQGLRRTYPEVHLHTLEEWLRNEGWHKRARHVRAP